MVRGLVGGDSVLGIVVESLVGEVRWVKRELVVKKFAGGK